MIGPVSITWWGHASTTIEVGGLRILTDPVLTRRIAHLSRVAGPLPDRAARDADVVLVSHLHLDHLHVPSLAKLRPDARIVAPHGAAGMLRRAAPRLSRRLEEVCVGDVVAVDAVWIRAVPAAHDGRRSPVSRHRGPALGFVIETAYPEPAQRIWFAGDTGLFDAMTELAPVDIAVVPVGGWAPTLGPTHLDPAQAAEAVRRVGAHDAVPIHYGTFWPTGLRHLHPPSFARHFTDPGTRFAEHLACVYPASRAHVIEPGQTTTIVGPR